MSLSNLLQHGHSAEEALALLIRNSPKIKKQAHKLLHSGWGINEVLSHFGNTKSGENVKAKPVSPSEIAALSIYKGRKKSGEEALTNLAKTAAPLALGVAGSALATPYLARALPGIAGALSGRGAAAAGPAAQAIQAATGAVSAPNSAAPMNGPEELPAVVSDGQQPSAPPVENAVKLLGKEKFVENLSLRNPPDVIAAYLNYQLKPEQKQFVKDNNIDLVKEVSDYVGNQSKTSSSQQPPAQAPPAQIEQQQPAPQPVAIESKPTEVMKQAEPAKPDVGKEVSLPDGSIGQIEEIDDKKRYASVNVDGKTRRVKLEDINVEPEDVVAFVNQISGVPESERSRLISFFAYQPETHTLAVQYHNGEFYTYDDVDAKSIEPVVSASGVAKTTGKDEYGAHVAGRPDSRGAALIENIINTTKYKKPGKGEEKNPNYKRFNTLYDYFHVLRRKSKKKKVGVKP